MSLISGNLTRLLPFLRWRQHVNRTTLLADFKAGLTGAIIVLPQGVALATIAGMPPEYGLYASMVPAIIAALFGSSWHLVSGPTTAASVLLFSMLSEHAVPGSADYIALAITLTFMVGIFQLGMGIAKLGTLVNFISHSVIVGFTGGAAVLIATNQVNNFFGLDVPGASHFVATLIYFIEHLGDIDKWVLLVASTTLLCGIASKKLFPSLPSMITALLGGSLVAWMLTNWLGVNEIHITMVGALPSQLPPLSAPSVSIEVFSDLGLTALALTLFALTEAMSISRSISLRSGQAIEGNQEFIGQGLSNIAGSFFSAYVATGSFNRSAINYDAGARTPLAAIMAGLILIAIVPFITPLAAYLPKATMAGILFLVAWQLFDFHHIGMILRASRNESAVLIVTFLSALFLNLESAILLGVLLSLALYLKRTSKPRMLPRVPNPDSTKRKFTTSMRLPECPQLKMVRLDDSLYFGAVAHVREIFRRFREHYPEQKHLLLLAQGVAQVDVAGAELLAHETKARESMGGALHIYRLRDSACDVLRRGGYLGSSVPESIYQSKGEAIATIFEQFDKSICQRCDKRIFSECTKIPFTDEHPKPISEDQS
jgi:sulfate permease, SulP family